MTGDRDDDATHDASRRTHLAEERTYLAWFRSGIAVLAVSVGVGRLLPALLDTSRIAFLVLGIGYAGLGTFLLAYGLVRHRSVDRALGRGTFAQLPAIVPVALTLSGAALALGTLVVLLME